MKMGDACLEKRNCVHYLAGVKIDRDLSWRTHINHLHRQCRAKLAVIIRASRYSTPEHQKAVLIRLLSHARPVDYCCMEPLWCHVERSCGKDTKERPENHPRKASQD